MGTFVMFNTRLGWMGAYVTSRGIRRVVLPQRTPDEAASALGEFSGEMTDDASPGEGIDQECTARDFAIAVARYFEGDSMEFRVPIDAAGLSEFQIAMMSEISKIPRGMTLSYSELARRAGKPGAARAAGRACANNPVPILVPCHRVVGSAGLGGFGGGVGLKKELLDLEGAVVG